MLWLSLPFWALALLSALMLLSEMAALAARRDGDDYSICVGRRYLH